MDLNLKGLVFVVGVGSADLGVATAMRLVAEGARVVLAAADESSLGARSLGARSLGRLDDLDGSAVERVLLDLAEPGTGERLVSAAMSRWGRLDGALLHLPGLRHGSRAGSEEMLTEAFRAAFLGMVRPARQLAKNFTAGGSVVLVIDAESEEHADRLVASSLRRGLSSVALELADELGPHGVRVNGLVAGPMEPTSTDHGVPIGTTPIDDVPLGRLGTPEEFARVAAFVLSPSASYISGSIIPVDGGLSRSL